MFNLGDKVKITTDDPKSEWNGTGTVTRGEHGGLVNVIHDQLKKEGGFFPRRLTLIDDVDPVTFESDSEAIGYEYKVEHISEGLLENTLKKLEISLNEHDQNGFEVMSVGPTQQGFKGYVLIVRKAKDV